LLYAKSKFKNNMRVVIALAPADFDPSEVAVPWKYLKQNGVEVVFASPDGKQAHVR
jgi:protease I